MGVFGAILRCHERLLEALWGGSSVFWAALVWTWLREAEAWLVGEAWLVREAWLAAWLVREASGSRVLLTFLAFRRIVFLH